jgi:hypothetical protein
MATASRPRGPGLGRIVKAGKWDRGKRQRRYKGLRPLPRAASAQITATLSQLGIMPKPLDWFSQRHPGNPLGYPGLTDDGARWDSKSLRDDKRGSNRPDSESWRPKAKHRPTRAAYTACNFM